MSDRFVQVDPRAFSGNNDFADIMTNGSTTPRRSLNPLFLQRAAEISEQFVNPNRNEQYISSEYNDACESSM